MTPTLLLAAATTGAFAFTVTLWLTGFGAISAEATGRLARLRDAGANVPAARQAEPFSLRKRGGISLGGVNVVSANISQKWTTQLERAGLTLNAREYLILRLIIALAAGAIGVLLLPMPVLAIGVALLGFMGMGVWLNLRIASRKRKIEGQVVEMLQMLASGLRAGFGLLQALEASAEQLPDPLAVEIRRTLRDIAVGASVEQALSALNERIGSADVDIVITAMLIQRSVGGNLAEILDNVAHTMRERERIRGEIRTLTSQQRLTGFVIGGIPIGLLIIFMAISPDFTGLLFTDPTGRMMLGTAAVMEVLGFLVIRKIVNIEV
ncbi:MAG: type II secretion system F family protein [Dehalococcoidia bacterium]|nr:type II secretion system F family protein [Dehalococcoidia bacterium]